MPRTCKSYYVRIAATDPANFIRTEVLRFWSKDTISYNEYQTSFSLTITAADEGIWILCYRL